MKKLLLLLCLVILGLAAGCTFSREHNRRHWLALKQDIHEMHKFADKYFANFDWDDPNRY